MSGVIVHIAIVELAERSSIKGKMKKKITTKTCVQIKVGGKAKIPNLSKFQKVLVDSCDMIC